MGHNCHDKHECCSKNTNVVPDVDDQEMTSMVATGAILIGGFFAVAFVSGPLGLVLTLIALSLLGLYFAVYPKK